jgi:hypothetical protein
VEVDFIFLKEKHILEIHKCLCLSTSQHAFVPLKPASSTNHVVVFSPSTFFHLPHSGLLRFSGRNSFRKQERWEQLGSKWSQRWGALNSSPHLPEAGVVPEASQMFVCVHAGICAEPEGSRGSRGVALKENAPEGVFLCWKTCLAHAKVSGVL